MFVSILLTIALYGLIAYLIDRFIPMKAPFDLIFRIVCVVIAVLLLLQLVGVHFGVEVPIVHVG